jgi:trans-aconitate methyltransferase
MNNEVPMSVDTTACPQYYQLARPEVARLVPPDARFVVDVGCGAGALGHALKQSRPGLEVRGIEPVQTQADLARQVLDAAHCGTAEAGPPQEWPSADCVIFADVLEHLVDPWQTLKSWRARLRAGATLVVSLPNVSNSGVVGGMLRGRWDYQDWGVLDRTHLRFFTRATGVELIESAGFRVQTVRRIFDMPVRGFGAPLRGIAALYARWERLSSRPGLTSFIADVCTVQFLIVATADAEAPAQ